MWLHLDDVYWSQQGRKSLDAVAIVLVVTASVRAFLDLLQVFQTSAEMGDLAWLLWFLVAITVIPAVVCLLKGKLVTTALGIVYQPIGIIGACRLAKPGSFWARHLYGPRSRRLTRAERRFGAAYAARLDRWRDIVGGAPADRDVTPPDTYLTPPDTTTAGEPIGGAPADPTG